MKVQSEDVKIYLFELDAEEANVLKIIVSKMLSVTAYFEKGYAHPSLKKGMMSADLRDLLFHFAEEHRQDLLNLDAELFEFEELPGMKGIWEREEGA